MSEKKKYEINDKYLDNNVNKNKDVQIMDSTKSKKKDSYRETFKDKNVIEPSLFTQIGYKLLGVFPVLIFLFCFVWFVHFLKLIFGF